MGSFRACHGHCWGERRIVGCGMCALDRHHFSFRSLEKKEHNYRSSSSDEQWRTKIALGLQKKCEPSFSYARTRCMDTCHAVTLNGESDLSPEHNGLVEVRLGHFSQLSTQGIHNVVYSWKVPSCGQRKVSRFLCIPIFVSFSVSHHGQFVCVCTSMQCYSSLDTMVRGKTNLQNIRVEIRASFPPKRLWSDVRTWRKNGKTY